ncbi:hypothetical protein ACWO4B_001218 [Clostridium sporogenes]
MQYHGNYTKLSEKVKMITIFISDGQNQIWDEEKHIKEVNWL